MLVYLLVYVVEGIEQKTQNACSPGACLLWRTRQQTPKQGSVDCGHRLSPARHLCCK